MWTGRKCSKTFSKTVGKTGYFGEKNKLETWWIMPFQPLRILLLNTNIIMVMTIILTVV